MSNEIAISVRNLSKAYQLYEKPIDRLKEALHPFKKKYHQDFFALKDVSFDVKKGETVGILGQNGAGKSTLLKIITGVLTPSSGEVQVKGKISSLLELGTGFNPELNAIENIYFYGGIIGFTREEMGDKMNDILDFADIGDFIHQPVKTYSSGMYVRLAFAAAISVDPEILIIDEALAVGDARFQLKCARKLDKIKMQGTTILFVSHATEQIKSLCSKGLLLNAGKQLIFGESKEVCARYFQLLFPEEENESCIAEDDEKIKIGVNTLAHDEKAYCLKVKPEEVQSEKFGIGAARIDWIKIYGLEAPNIFHGGELIRVLCKYSWNSERLREQRLEKNLKDNLTFGFSIANTKGEYLFGLNGFDYGLQVCSSTVESAVVEISFDMPFLKSGNYFSTLALALGCMQNHEQQKWYDYCIDLQCSSKKKNVYGFFHLDYEMRVVN